MKSKLKKDIYDEWTKGFWEAAEEAAREVATWPAWKRLEGPAWEPRDKPSLHCPNCDTAVVWIEVDENVAEICIDWDSVSDIT